MERLTPEQTARVLDLVKRVQTAPPTAPIDTMAMRRRLVRLLFGVRLLVASDA